MNHDIPELVSINVLAATLSEVQRERVVRQTLGAVRSGKTRHAQRVKRAIGDHVTIDGFRDAAKALTGKFDATCKEVARRMMYISDLAGPILAAWVDIHGELRSIVEPALDTGGIQRLPINGTIHVEQNPGQLGTALKMLGDAHDDLDPDDLRLMIACLSGQIPLSPDNSQESANDAPLHERNEGACMIWDTWMPDLEALPPGATEWDEVQIAAFVQTLTELAGRKRAERAAGRIQLRDSLETLRAHHLARLQFVVVETTAAAWDAEHIELNRADALAGAVTVLIELLQSHAEIEQRSYKNAPERRQRDADMRELEDKISAMHNVLADAFADASSRPSSSDTDDNNGTSGTEQGAEAALPVTTESHDATLVDAAQDAAPVLPEDHAVDTVPLPMPGPTPPEPALVERTLITPEAGQADDELMPIDLDVSATMSVSATTVPDEQDELQPFDLGTPTTSPAWPTLEAHLDEPLAQQNTDDTAATQESDQLLAPASDSLIAEIAGRLLGGELRDRAGAFAAIIWQLMHEERYGLAYHLTRHLETSADDAPIPSPLVRAVTLAPHVRYDVGEVASLLKHDYTVLPPLLGGAADQVEARSLLLVAATLRPALLAPGTGAPTILKSVPPLSGLPTFYRYCQTIADYGQYQQPLDMTALRFVSDRAAWQSELNALCRQVDEWSNHATSRTNKYAKAGTVWRRWQKSDGPIGKLLTPVRKNDVGQIADVRAAVDRLTDHEEFRRMVCHTDRVELGRRGGDDIHGPALNQLQLHTEQAIEYARQWVRLQECRPDGRSNFFQAQAERLRSETLSNHAQVMSELDSYEQRHAPLSSELTLALACCRRTLSQIGNLFDEYAAALADEPLPRYLLNAVLLRSTDIQCDDQWEPLTSGEALERALLEIARTPDTDWQRVLEAWCERRDHEQTRRVLEAARAVVPDSAFVATLEAYRDRQLQSCGAALVRDSDETRRHIENAVAYGLLREEERNSFLSRIQQIDIAQPDLRRFAPAHDALLRIRDEITVVRESKIASVRQRLASFGITSEHVAYARITTVLDEGDALAADEYIDMVLANQPLPERQAQQDVFADFYPTAVRDVVRSMEDGNASQAIERAVRELRERARGRARGRIPLPLFDRRDIPGPHADEAANLLEAWFVAKNARRLNRTTAEQIVNNLGFTMISLSSQEPGRIARYSLTTRPIQNKNLCPVWQYGTGARGSYRLLCAWDRPTESELVSVLEEQAHDAPAIVFYFGRMTEPRRKELARLCRERRVTCVLIDDLLLMYLCTLPAPRLPHLFDCTLPFAHLDPYTTTAGIVPPEVFYGRQRERKQILDPMGSCFIYGGRQLGKTALLRDIEREMHDPSLGRIVIWIDLKAEGIGNQHAIDSIWVVIARELQKQGVIPEKAPAHVSADRLLQYIQNWLDTDQTRRILLLLDEADKFLANDGRVERTSSGDVRDAFHRASQIKGLMDRTNRRFKVVFAGLHNVKRTTRQSNHPLAHYGDPICIGPLLEDGEWRAARALIERPLASLGFRFESPDLVTRILSQTNYYPSLIQLYGKQLIKHLTDPHAAIDGPPYTITSRHVEEVYQSQSLRDDIRQRFNLTIQLDQRYEVIAYVAAYGSLSDDGHGMVDGFSVDWIRQQALTWWAAGFHESATEDQFLALLDEMVGLGILRIVRSGYYTLRSPNVVLLMGTLDQIEAELVRDREPPIEYERETFRAAYRDDRKASRMDLARRSPLTALQESEIVAPSNGAAIICGSHAAGRDDIEAFLKLAVGQEQVKTLRFVNDRAAFGRELDTIMKGRPDSGTTVVFVSPACPWSEAWIDDALDRLQALRSRTSWVRVAFIAEPMMVWRLLNQASSSGEERLHPETLTLTLGPWHDSAVRQWLDDCGFGLIDRQGRQRIREVTGNWPMLLTAFHEQTRANTRYWQAALQSIQEQQRTAGQQVELFKQFELSPSLPLDVLRSIVQWGEGAPLAVEDIIADLGEEAADRVRLSLRWADLLGFASPAGNDAWHVDPLVRAALAAPGR